MIQNVVLRHLTGGKSFRNRRIFAQSGTDVTILKIFSPKNLAKNWRF
jgi:hypothetical protein